LGLWGAKYTSIAHPFAQFQTDAASGNLPSISYVDPRYLGEGAGTSNDDHPFADIRNGQVLMNEVYQTLFTAPTAAKTLLIVNYDEWGGFADHVAPRLASVSAAEVKAGNVDVHNSDGTGFAYLGFRTPLLLIGPQAYRNTISDTPFDPNSILNFICWRFGLSPLGVRAATSGNIATALNLSGAPNAMPAAVSTLSPYNPTTGLSYGGACTATSTADLKALEDNEHITTLLAIKDMMITHGFEMV
jgi:phospholipase C